MEQIPLSTNLLWDEFELINEPISSIEVMTEPLTQTELSRVQLYKNHLPANNDKNKLKHRVTKDLMANAKKPRISKECEESLGQSIVLYPFQREAVDQLVEKISKVEYLKAGSYQYPFFNFFAHVLMPVGSGKTYIGLSFIDRLVNSPDIIAKIYNLCVKHSCSLYSNCEIGTSRFIDYSLPKHLMRVPSQKYLILVPRSVAFQWEQKARRFFGDAFDKKVICVIRSKDIDRITSAHSIFIVQSNLEKAIVKKLPSLKFDVLVCDEMNPSKTIFEWALPFFMCLLSANKEATVGANVWAFGSKYDFGASRSTIGNMFHWTSCDEYVTTIDDKQLRNLFELAPIDFRAYTYSVSQYAGVFEELAADWPDIFLMHTVPRNIVKEKLLTELELKKAKLEKDKAILGKKESALAKLLRLPNLIDSSETATEKVVKLDKRKEKYQKIIKSLVSRINADAEKIRNVEEKIKDIIDCIICQVDVPVDQQIHLKCCKAMCCLECIKRMIQMYNTTLKSYHRKCPQCRKELDYTLKDFMNYGQNGPDCLELFSRVFSSLSHSKKIVVVFAQPLLEVTTSFQNLVGEEQAVILSNAGGAIGIKNQIEKFRDLPAKRVLFLDSVFSNYGLDLEFVDDMIILAAKKLPDHILNQLIGRVQRFGRMAPLTVHNFYGSISNERPAI